MKWKLGEFCPKCMASWSYWKIYTVCPECGEKPRAGFPTCAIRRRWPWQKWEVKSVKESE